VVRQKKQSLFALLSVFRDSVLLLAFQRFLKLLTSPLVGSFFASRNSIPILEHRPALVAVPALIRAVAIRRRSPINTSPAVLPTSTIHTASSFRYVAGIREAPPL